MNPFPTSIVTSQSWQSPPDQSTLPLALSQSRVEAAQGPQLDHCDGSVSVVRTVVRTGLMVVSNSWTQQDPTPP